ncbi:MAG TPA: outer membrane beta-barrel protein [Steroidobacteraceae bacterium]|nr:outer membrane beta-barrel protein [Steroidobacteraceae bacterium]
MNLLKAMLGGLMLAAAPLAALAEDMSYSYIDLAYVDTDIDGVGPSLDGFGLRGSIGFAENWFAFGEFAAQSVSGVDLDTYTVGLGGHYGVADNLDLFGRLGWTKVEISSGPIDIDDDGYLIDAGLRGRVGDAVELEGGVRYTDFSDGGDATGLFVGGRFHFNETWALGAEYQDGDDASTILAYVRASF